MHGICKHRAQTLVDRLRRVKYNPSMANLIRHVLDHDRDPAGAEVNLFESHE